MYVLQCMHSIGLPTTEMQCTSNTITAKLKNFYYKMNECKTPVQKVVIILLTLLCVEWGTFLLIMEAGRWDTDITQMHSYISTFRFKFRSKNSYNEQWAAMRADCFRPIIQILKCQITFIYSFTWFKKISNYYLVLLRYSVFDWNNIFRLCV